MPTPPAKKPGRPAKPKPEKAVIMPAPVPGVAPSLLGIRTADPQREYVARSVGGYNAQQNIEQLAQTPDDLVAELGYEPYERMMNDPIIRSNYYLFADAIFDQDFELHSAVQDKSSPDYDTALMVYDVCKWALAPFAECCRDVMRGMWVEKSAFGNKVGEKVWEVLGHGKGAGYLALKDIKPKSYDVVGFVVDRHMNNVGIAAYTGYYPDGDGTPAYNPQHIATPYIHGAVRTSVLNSIGWQVFPREKFYVLTNAVRNGDPRGTAGLRSIYNEWYILMNLWPEYYKYLRKFGSPSIVGYTAEKARSRRDETTNAIIQPTTDMLGTLLAFEGSSVAAFPFSSKIDLLRSEGQGEAFIGAINELERRIQRGITAQTLANSEGKHMARAAAGTHKDMFDISVMAEQAAMCRAFTKEVLRPIVEYNLGPKYLEFVPTCQLGGIPKEDVAALGMSVAALQRAGYIHPSQYRQIDKMMGFPYRAEPEAGFVPAGAMSDEMLDAAVDKTEAEAKAIENPPQPVGGDGGGSDSAAD